MNNTVKRAIVLFAAAAYTLCMCACEDAPAQLPANSSQLQSGGDGGGAVYDSFSLPYSSKSGFNPFTTDSFLNLSISQIVAETLTFTEKDEEAEMVLAESVTCDEENAVYTVSLKSGILFSDGSALTSADVAASVNSILANADSYYFSLVKNVAGVSATDDTSVVFTLKRPDPEFEKMLCFPVVKEGSTGEDYVGTGAYVLSTDGSGNAVLKYNALWRNGDVASHTINLVATENAAELHYMLQTGAIDYYYTTDASNTSGSFSGEECETDIFGFLMFNTGKGIMSSPDMRAAVAGAFDREMLIDRCAVFASSNCSAGASGTQTDVDACMEAAGYTMTDENGLRYKESTSGRKTYASISLWYISTDGGSDGIAEEIKRQLEGMGFKVASNGYDSLEDMISSAKRSSPDIVYAEYRVPPNSDLSGLLDASYGAAAVMGGLGDIWNEYELYRSSEISREDFENVLAAEMPFTKLYIRKAKTLYSRLFAESIKISARMAYPNADKWYMYE